MSQLETIVAYLAGQVGTATDLVRREMLDAGSETHMVVATARQWTRQMFGETALRRLGLSARARHRPPVAEPQVPRAPRRWWVLWLPWLLCAVSTTAAVLLALNCPGHRQHVLHFLGVAGNEPAAEVASTTDPPKADPKAVVPDKLSRKDSVQGRRLPSQVPAQSQKPLKDKRPAFQGGGGGQNSVLSPVGVGATGQHPLVRRPSTTNHK
jgi:hypothetical protein